MLTRGQYGRAEARVDQFGRIAGRADQLGMAVRQERSGRAQSDQLEPDVQAAAVSKRTAPNNQLATQSDQAYTDLLVAQRHMLLVDKFVAEAAAWRVESNRLAAQPGRAYRAEQARVRATELELIARRHRMAAQQRSEKGEHEMGELRAVARRRQQEQEQQAQEQRARAQQPPPRPAQRPPQAAAPRVPPPPPARPAAPPAPPPARPAAAAPSVPPARPAAAPSVPPARPAARPPTQPAQPQPAARPPAPTPQPQTPRPPVRPPRAGPPTGRSS